MPISKNQLIVKGTDDWYAWVEGYAAHKRTSLAELVDTALAGQAIRDGYRPAAPRRTRPRGGARPPGENPGKIRIRGLQSDS